MQLCWKGSSWRKKYEQSHPLLLYILLVTASALICILLSMNVVYCAFSNLQSSIIVFSCWPLYNKIITGVWEICSQWDHHRNDWYHWVKRRKGNVVIEWESRILAHCTVKKHLGYFNHILVVSVACLLCTCDTLQTSTLPISFLIGV